VPTNYLKNVMKLFKLLTLKTIFYLLLILGAVIYYAIIGVNPDNETDFLITLLAVAILAIAFITEIKVKMKSLKKETLKI
jgi:hypothetical protein